MFNSQAKVGRLVANLMKRVLAIDPKDRIQFSEFFNQWKRINVIHPLLLHP